MAEKAVEIHGSEIVAMTSKAVVVATDEYTGDANSVELVHLPAGNIAGVPILDVYINVTAVSGDCDVSILVQKLMSGSTWQGRRYALAAKPKEGQAAINAVGQYYCGSLGMLPPKMKLEAKVENGTSMTFQILVMARHTQSETV